MNMVSASRFRLADFLGNTTQWELRASADLLPHYAVLPYLERMETPPLMELISIRQAPSPLT